MVFGKGSWWVHGRSARVTNISHTIREFELFLSCWQSDKDGCSIAGFPSYSPIMFRMKTLRFQQSESFNVRNSLLKWFRNMDLMFVDTMIILIRWIGHMCGGRTLEIFLKVVSDVVLVKFLQCTFGRHWIITLSIRKIENQNRRNLCIPNATYNQSW